MHTQTSKPVTATAATTLTPAMVAMDIDGTIVKTGQTIPAEAIHAIHDFINAGNHLVLATGRSPAGALDVVRQLGLRHGWVVLSGGAAIARIEATPITRRPRLVIHHQVTFDPSSVLLRALGAAPDALLAVEDTGRGGWLVNQRFERGSLNGRQRRVWEHDLRNTRTTRAVVHAEDVAGLVYDLACYGASVTPAGSDWLDLTAKKISKGTALERVRRVLHVDQHATIAIGDSTSDVAAFEWAQTAVAMGNACQQVQAAADYVTDSIDQHGAARTLRTLTAGR